MDNDQRETTERGNEPLESIVGCAKVLLALASVFGLMGWLYVVLLSLGWYGFPRTLLEAFGLFYPFIYLSSAIYCCWVNLPLRKLMITALLFNLPVVAFSIYGIVELGGLPPGVVVCFVFIVLWSLLCVARRYGDKN